MEEMTQTTSVFEALCLALSQVANVEADSISIDDHLEDDVYLDLDADVPKVVAVACQELKIEVEADTIAEFIREAHTDPIKGTVAELLEVLNEELEFN